MLDIDVDDFGFVKTLPFSEVRTRREGVFAAGTLTGPTDIAESVIRASAAALNGSRAIHRAGGGLAATATPTEAYRDVSREPPSILVVRCRCGDNPEDDTHRRAIFARLEQDPAVAHVRTLDRICTPEGWAALRHLDTAAVNRVLLAACRTFVYGNNAHKLAEAFGLHPALIEAVPFDGAQNPSSPAAIATIRAGIARLKNAAMDARDAVAVVNRALVVGGGIAGMHAALAVADHGVNVTLVEASDRLGGNLAWLHQTLDGTPIAPFLEETAGRVHAHPGIRVMTGSRVVGAFGQAGHFFSAVETTGEPAATIEHGAVILATGGREAPTDAYGYGASKAVITQRELEIRIAENRLDAVGMSAVAMILCVDSREEPRNYCSRVCCPTALKQALWLKAHNPDLMVYILYRDMMTCGLAETWYTEARRQGILFFQYQVARKPQVSIPAAEKAPVTLRLCEPILDAPISITADLLVLAPGIRPHLPEELALAYGARRDQDGFFLEADAKWRPVEALAAGVFGCGIALSPRSISESVATAEAAAGRALAILAHKTLPASRTAAIVRHSLCSLCLRCLDTCPYDARFLDEDEQRVAVNPALCQGCGDCASVCPNGASIVEGFSRRGVLAAIDGALMAD